MCLTGFWFVPLLRFKAWKCQVFSSNCLKTLKKTLEVKTVLPHKCYKVIVGAFD